MPRARNELGQFVKNDGGIHFNYMPTFYTIFLNSLGFFFYGLISMVFNDVGVKAENIQFIYLFGENDSCALDGSGTTSKHTPRE